MRLCLAVLALGLVVRATSQDVDNEDSSVSRPHMPTTTTQHAHGHAAPLLELNETEVLLHHAPDPLSYWAYDNGMKLASDSISLVPSSPDDLHHDYRILIVAHVAAMIIAFFGILPIGIVLRATKHRHHAIVQIAFLVLVITGRIFGAIYTHLTPDLYPGEIHSRFGSFVLFLVAAVAVYDSFGVIERAYSFLRHGTLRRQQSFWDHVTRSEPIVRSRYAPCPGGDVRDDESEEDSTSSTLLDNKPASPILPSGSRNSQESIPLVDTSRSDFSKLPDADYDLRDTRSRAQRSAAMSVCLGEWALIAFGFFQLVTGGAVYSGICRATYLNGCMGHLIKGGLLFMYGVLTFCRYLGAFSQYGWAWNRVPTKRDGKSTSSRYPSAEMIDSFLVFAYGITNTWMERFGAKPGDPYTTRQIQHISIPVLWWFGGLISMALESQRVRRLIVIATSSLDSPASRDHAARSEPSSGESTAHTGSFNPLPALIVGITGSAMAAHTQTYLFAVHMHMLWGNLFLAFAVMRCLTYVFLWLKPASERSDLPSRPPTEALASLFLACGGLALMASTEQIEFGAMRHGYDHIMLIFNVVVSTVCLVFCWATVTLVVKGWARSQTRSYRNNTSNTTSDV